MKNIELIKQRIRQGNPLAQPDSSDAIWSLRSQYVPEFPTDYRELIDWFGGGVVADYLVVFSPSRSRDDIDIERRGKRTIADFKSVSALNPDLFRGLDWYPAAGGLLPFAATYNNETLFWKTSSSNPDPNYWSIEIFENAWERWSFPGRFSELLAGVLSDSVSCPMLPQSVFSKDVITWHRSEKRAEGAEPTTSGRDP
jgi:hypothetical protein